MTPTVSFVVPCYNYGRYLGDCLTSIFTQEGHTNFEVIAIDDASTDNTQEVLRSFADPRLQIITHETNRGHVFTINEGLSRTQGTFIARIDPDDRYRSCFLTEVLSRFWTYPEVGMVYGNVALIDDAGEVTVAQSDRVHRGKDQKGNEFLPLLVENFICAPTVIARREVWQEALPIPDGLAFSDWYLTVMMARRHEFYYIDRVIADYRVHAANHHTTIVRDRSEEESIFRLLNMIFAERELDATLQAGKARSRGRVYAAHYLTLATKYFGMRMDADAWRCYCRALRYQPQQLFRFVVWRHLTALLIGRDLYERSKVFIKSVRTRAASGL
jgi:glycosyltransferase involved in cell wall biosynthesis